LLFHNFIILAPFSTIFVCNDAPQCAESNGTKGDKRQLYVIILVLAWKCRDSDVVFDDLCFGWMNERRTFSLRQPIFHLLF